MFGLTKREQRWKAEQRAAELLAAVFKDVVALRIAETNAEALKVENERLRAQLAATESKEERA